MERKETKEEIIAAIKKCAAELGHAPTVAEVRKATRLTKFAICRHFANFEAALCRGHVSSSLTGFLIG